MSDTIHLEGGWRVATWLRGHSFHGMARCTRGEGEVAVATFTPPQRAPLADIRRRLGYAVSGVAALVDIVDVLDAHGNPTGAALLEAEPPGTPLTPRSPALPMREAARIVRAAASAVAAAQADGVVLGGIRPETIYCDGEDSVILLPRWAAFVAGRKPPSHGDVFPFDHAYEALETSTRPGPASDTFSLCAVLVRLLTGEPPFGDGPLAEQFVRMSQAATSTDVPGAPPELSELVRRGLSADPEQRPAASALLAALSVEP